MRTSGIGFRLLPVANHATGMIAPQESEKIQSIVLSHHKILAAELSPLACKWWLFRLP
jgi:hypothetical protein